MITKQTYAELVQEGFSMEIGRLSIAPIKRYGNKIWYQVHCDDYRDTFSRLHKDIFDAVDDFVDTKNKLRREQ